MAERLRVATGFHTGLHTCASSDENRQRLAALSPPACPRDAMQGFPLSTGLLGVCFWGAGPGKLVSELTLLRRGEQAPCILYETISKKWRRYHYFQNIESQELKLFSSKFLFYIEPHTCNEDY